MGRLVSSSNTVDSPFMNIDVCTGIANHMVFKKKIIRGTRWALSIIKSVLE